MTFLSLSLSRPSLCLQNPRRSRKTNHSCIQSVSLTPDYFNAKTEFYHQFDLNSKIWKIKMKFLSLSGTHTHTHTLSHAASSSCGSVRESSRTERGQWKRCWKTSTRSWEPLGDLSFVHLHTCLFFKVISLIIYSFMRDHYCCQALICPFIYSSIHWPQILETGKWMVIHLCIRCFE